jgi:hypothetical protein
MEQDTEKTPIPLDASTPTATRIRSTHTIQRGTIAEHDKSVRNRKWGTNEKENKDSGQLTTQITTGVNKNELVYK